MDSNDVNRFKCVARVTRAAGAARHQAAADRLDCGAVNAK
jgi:hypothetical protein